MSARAKKSPKKIIQCMEPANAFAKPKCVLERLVHTVAQELGRNKEEAESIFRYLYDESWFDSTDSLKALTDEEWNSLALPIRFKAALKRKLESDDVRADPARESPPPEHVPQAESDGNNTGESLTEVTYEPPPSDSVAASLSAISIVGAMKCSMSEAEFNSAIGATYRYTKALIDCPSDPRLRKILRTNKVFAKCIEPHRLAVELLLSFGFVSAGPFLILPTLYMSRIADAEAAMRPHLSSQPNAKPTQQAAFNPYRSNILAQTQQSLADPNLDPAFIRNEIQREKQRLRGEPLAQDAGKPQITIYPVKRVSPERDIMGIENQQENEDINLGDIKARILAMAKAPTFKMRAQEELERLRQTPGVGLVMLRVEDPAHVVELQVPLRWTVGNLLRTLRTDAFRAECREMDAHLISPPSSKPLDYNTSLLDILGMVGRARLRLVTPQGTSVFKG